MNQRRIDPISEFDLIDLEFLTERRANTVEGALPVSAFGLTFVQLLWGHVRVTLTLIPSHERGAIASPTLFISFAYLHVCRSHVITNSVLYCFRLACAIPGDCVRTPPRLPPRCG